MDLKNLERAMRAVIVAPDGTASDLTGRSIFLPFERFRDEICRKGSCFVCGSPRGKNFNDEHVIPNWLQRHCGLHKETLTLPNGVRVKYGTYKIPCCEGCNSLLGDIYETPISKAMCGGYDSVIEFIKEGGASLLCSWLALIFLKVHLLDFKNKMKLDDRENAGFIGDAYELGELHHIHAIARARTAGVHIDENVLGSLVVLRVHHDLETVDYDYCDNLLARGLLLQIKDVAFIHIIDDCGATIGMLSEQLKTIPDPITRLQLREVYAKYLAANLHLENSPEFRTEFVGPYGQPTIRAGLPEFKVREYEPTVFGQLLAGSLGELAEAIIVNGKTGDEALSLIESERPVSWFC